MHLVGIAGSLRAQSFNHLLLQATQKLLPEYVTLEIATLHDVPLFNQDVEAQGVPEGVLHLRERIHQADALLIATPEYNHAVPGVLKNAIDWLSRSGPQGERPLSGKPLAILGATPGGFGTVHAQTQLRSIAQALNMYTLNRPEVLVSRVHTKFDGEHLVDQTTRDQLRQMVEALVQWTHTLKQE